MKRKTSLKFLAVLAISVVLVMTMTVFAFAEGESEEVEYVSNFYSTMFSLLPPVIAIALALITKKFILHSLLVF